MGEKGTMNERHIPPLPRGRAALPRADGLSAIERIPGTGRGIVRGIGAANLRLRLGLRSIRRMRSGPGWLFGDLRARNASLVLRTSSRP